MFMPVVSCTTLKALSDKLRAWLNVEVHNLDPEFEKIIESEVNFFVEAISSHPPDCPECAANRSPARCVRVGDGHFGLAQRPWRAGSVAGTDMESARSSQSDGWSARHSSDRPIPEPESGEPNRFDLS